MPEAKLRKVEDVQLYARRDEDGKLEGLDAIDFDRGKIRRIADRLQRRGFGVVREVSKRSGQTHYRFKAIWAAPGDPPEDPFEG